MLAVLAFLPNKPPFSDLSVVKTVQFIFDIEFYLSYVVKIQYSDISHLSKALAIPVEL